MQSERYGKTMMNIGVISSVIELYKGLHITLHIHFRQYFTTYGVDKMKINLFKKKNPFNNEKERNQIKKSQCKKKINFQIVILFSYISTKIFNFLRYVNILNIL